VAGWLASWVAWWVGSFLEGLVLFLCICYFFGVWCLEFGAYFQVAGRIEYLARVFEPAVVMDLKNRFKSYPGILSPSSPRGPTIEE
jgi:hypothetical protein